MPQRVTGRMRAVGLWPHAVFLQELAPHVSVCVAPRVGIESHPVEDFRMIVPEQARHALGVAGLQGCSLWHMGLRPLAHRVAALARRASASSM
jgi:hypothetical protein